MLSELFNEWSGWRQMLEEVENYESFSNQEKTRLAISATFKNSDYIYAHIMITIYSISFTYFPALLPQMLQAVRIRASVKWWKSYSVTELHITSGIEEYFQIWYWFHPW